MTDVKCIAPQAASLPDGRLLPPGQTATGVDTDHPEVQAQIAGGALLVLDREKKSRGGSRAANPESTTQEV